MEYFIATLVVFALAILGMAAGVILSRKCLKRGCENAQAVMQHSGSSTCEHCGKKI